MNYLQVSNLYFQLSSTCIFDMKFLIDSFFKLFWFFSCNSFGHFSLKSDPLIIEMPLRMQYNPRCFQNRSILNINNQLLLK